MFRILFGLLYFGLFIACFYFFFFHLKRGFRKLVPRSVTYLNDPAPIEIIYQNRFSISFEQSSEDAFRPFWNKTSTRVALYKFSIVALKFYLLWVPAGFLFFALLTGSLFGVLTLLTS